MSDDCIFCKIVAGELPCTKVYEDDSVLAFMDIAPICKGHTLVIPKAHHETIVDTPDDLLKEVIVGVRKISISQKEALKADGIHVTQANGAIACQVVPHIHFHIIPRFKADDHSWVNPQREYDSQEEMQEFADRIRDGVSKLD